MDYTICVVPPGGGEQDHQITISDAGFVPRPGEYVIVRAPEMDEVGAVSAFRVRYTVTYAETADTPFGVARAAEIVVEAEPIHHPYATAAHRRNVDMYVARGLNVESFPDSGY